MLEHSRVVVNIHVWEGVGSTVAAQEQRVARTIVAGIVGIGCGTNQTTIGVLAMTCRDTLRDDGTLGVLTHVNHLGTGISLLIVVGNSHAVELCLRVVASQDARRILPSDGGTCLHLCPTQLRVDTTQIASLGYEVEHTTLAMFIARIPVLDGRVFHLGIVLDDNLDDSRMELVFITHWCGTTLQVRYVSIIIGDNQCTLKLTRVAGVDAEVTTQLHRATHALRNINEGTIAEHAAVQSCIEVITIRNNRSQIFLHQVRMLLDSLADTTKDNALLTELVLESSLHRYGVHDGIHGSAAQCQALLQRNAQLVEGLLQLRVYLLVLWLLRQRVGVV